jgi:thymidylate synthase (FAD)
VKATLISISKPAPELVKEGLYDVQELIAYCARVSNPSNQFNTQTSEKLIRYLIKHKHWSPLEMASACIEIETTRDIARQILRHRSFSFQEFSQRYADPTNELEFVLREARKQDPNNRQNSVELNMRESDRAVLPEGNTMSRLYVNGTLRSWVHYVELRSANETQKEHIEVARECAKAIAQAFPLINEFCQE